MDGRQCGVGRGCAEETQLSGGRGSHLGPGDPWWVWSPHLGTVRPASTAADPRDSQAAKEALFRYA
ncbi:hypothetical protein ABZT48_09945 [Streptomyces avermitilis]|uniref:hypothetical protein n=1 Tax=Streptomyces avermitilis TaxID=33903 RepID=UPI0033A82830